MYPRQGSVLKASGEPTRIRKQADSVQRAADNMQCEVNERRDLSPWPLRHLPMYWEHRRQKQGMSFAMAMFMLVRRETEATIRQSFAPAERDSSPRVR